MDGVFCAIAYFGLTQHTEIYFIRMVSCTYEFSVLMFWSFVNEIINEFVNDVAIEWAIAFCRGQTKLRAIVETALVGNKMLQGHT